MTTEYPRVALVASPDVDTEIRCDLNEDTTWPNHDAFSLGAPPLIGDPGGIGASYDFRTLSFNLSIDDGERRALAKQSQLARLLMRDENWLLFQLSPSAAPVWFRCVRSSPGEVSLATVYLDQLTSLWAVGVSLVAYPFAYGAVQTKTLTISNDPAPGGMANLLTGITGDAPTPLTIELPAGTSDAYARPYLAVTPLEVPWLDTQVWQAEDWTLTIASHAAVVADATASGGQAVAFDFAAANTTTLSIAGLVTPTMAGRWRLFARCKRGSVGPGHVLTVTGGGHAHISGEAQTLTTAGGWELVNLGEYVFPKGNMPGARPYALGADEVKVTFDNDDVVGAPRLDYVVAVPVSLPLDEAGRTTAMSVPGADSPTETMTMRINGDRQLIELIDNGVHGTNTPQAPEGASALLAHPGVTNVVHLLTRNADQDGTAVDDLDTEVQLSLSWRPRWLHLASD